MKKTSLLFAVMATQIAVFAQSTGSGIEPQLLTAPAGFFPSVENTTGQTPGTLDISAYAGKVFGFNAFAGTIPVGPFSFKLNNVAATALPTAPPANQSVFGAGWANGKWYGAYYPTNLLVTVDTVTGARTTVGSMAPVSGQTWTGMSYDMVGGVMYAVAASGSISNLYSVNLATGVATTVGAGASGVLLICLAANNAGQLFGVDIKTDKFGSVDKTTGAFTPIGSIGFNASYAQDMEFDHSDNTCYYTSYDSASGAADLRTVNVTTGATTVIGTFPAQSEVVGFAIPYSSSGILSNEKAIGTLRAYPNPFVDRTNITFSLTTNEKVLLEVFDVYGKKVATLVDGQLGTGSHTVTLNRADLSTGIYSCRLQTSTGTYTNKVVLAD